MTSFHGCLSAAVLAALVLAWSGPGHAQGKGKPKGGKPAASASADAGKGDAPPDPKIEEAKRHMSAGAALYNDPSGHKCEEAYVEFGKAFELSGSLNALRSRAVCALELEKDGEALNDYRKVLAGMGDKLAADVKAQIENDIRALDASTAWVTIKIDVPKAKLVDVRTPSRGLPVTNRYEIENGTKIGFHPGEHAFTLTTADGKERSWKASLENGSTHDYTFEFTKAAEPAGSGTAGAGSAAPTGEASGAPTASAGAESRPVPTSVKVMLGVTGAFAIGAGVMMGLASVAKSDYEAVNGKGTEGVDSLKSKRDNVILMNGIADGLLGGTVLAAGATLILYLIRPSVKAEEASKSGYYFAPAATPSAGGFVAGGRF